MKNSRKFRKSHKKKRAASAVFRTTSLYVEIDIGMKRKALEKCPPPGVVQDEPPLWHQPAVMALLNSIAKRSYVE